MEVIPLHAGWQPAHQKGQSLAEAAIEKALANGTNNDNKENPDALPSQRQSGRRSGAQVS
jgi:hypothetical protein